MAQTYHQMGIIRQDQGDYKGALDQYRQSLEINEKLGDQSGMANSFGQMGLLMQKLEKDQEAFGYFLQAFLIFARLQAPAARQAVRDLCDTARRNPDQWRGWLAGLVEDDGSRGQIEQMILSNMEPKEDQEAAAWAQMKEAYDQMGEEAFVKLVKEKSGQELPEEVLEKLRE